jgi:predicted CXXCH cytochrome family protein
MAPYGGTSKPFASYMKSVHARKLFQEGNENAPVCVDCHGVHGAAPPDYSNVDRVCGRCHTTTRHYFVSGSHAPELKNPDLPECSSCHDHHAVAASLDTDFGALCLTCHDEESGPAALGDRIEVLVRTAADEIEKADSLVAEAEKIPLDVRDHGARLREARTYLTEVLPVSHAVSLEPIEELTRRARSIASEVESEIHGKLRDHSTHRFGLVAFWFYVLLTAGILADLRRRGGRS